MPDVTFLNSIDTPIHIGIWAVTLHHYTNQLAPSANWTVHLASSPYTVEIRAGDEGTIFDKNTNRKAVEHIVAAWGHGTVSVLTTVGWELGMLGFGGPRVQAAVSAKTEDAFKTIRTKMGAAIKEGASYFEDKGPGHLLTAPHIMIGSDQGQYSVRQGEGKGKVQLWDDKDGRMKGEAA